MAISRVIRCGSIQFNIHNITVEPVVFLYMFASFIVFPTLQALAYHKVCTQRYNVTFCKSLQNASFQHQHPEENDYVQSETSHWILLANIAMTVPACFTVLFFLGSFGDKVGRKFPVLLPVIGGVAQSIASLFNALYPSASMYFLLIGPLLSGMCGGILAFLMAVYSYITYISVPDSKTTRISIVESMMFLAATLGVFVSGVMLDRTSFIFVFSFSVGLMCLAILYITLWLDDIKPQESVVARKLCGHWICDFLKESVACVRQPRGPHIKFIIVLLILCMDLLLLCTIGEMDILLLYLRRDPLGWSQSLFGYFKGMENLLRGLMLLLVLPLFKKKLHVRDTTVVIGGILSKVVGLVLMGLATQTWLVFLAGVVGMAQGLPAAGLRSMMSSLVRQDEQGRLFGMVAVTETVVGMVAASLFNTIYPRTLHFFPGFSFILAAFISLLALGIIIYLHVTGTAEITSPPPYKDMVEEEEEDKASVNTFHVASVADEDHFAYI